MLERLQENIEKQRAAVTKMADVDVPEVAGLEMLEGQLKLTGLNREMVDAFVEEIVVYVKDRVEIKWKFKDEFWEVRKVEKIEYLVENMEMGWYNCTHESISLER
jgi:site-specific DNA recombinase